MTDMQIDWAAAAAIAQAIATLLVGIQIYIIAKENARAHRRTKSRETIQAMNDFLRAIKNERLWLLDYANIEKLKSPATLSAQEYLIAEQFLGSAERLAVGARNDVYDLQIMRQTSRRFLTDSYYHFGAYIEFKRTKLKNPAIFEHYEWLIQALNIKRLAKPGLA